MTLTPEEREALDEAYEALRYDASDSARVIKALRDRLEKAEPVAWRYKAWPGDAEFSICLHDPAEFRDPSISCVQELFTAPTAPATPRVPGEATVFSAPTDYIGREIAWRDGWNACRSAMLAAAPSPQGDLRDERFGPVAMILRDICELDADDPEDPNTICINVETLERIVRKYIPAAPSSPAAEPWQPIETAPKDGTRFLALRELPVLDEDTGATTIEREHCIAQSMFGLMVHSIPVYAVPHGERITHWMPLPQPPTTGEAS